MRRKIVLAGLFLAIQSPLFSIDNSELGHFTNASFSENQNSKESAPANGNAQSKIEDFPPLIDKLSVGDIAYGFRRDTVKIPLLENKGVKRIESRSVLFRTDASKDFFILVFRGLSDSASIRLTLDDYTLISDDASIACCKGFNPVFKISAIHNGGSFNINDSVGFRYGGDGTQELFSCLLFVIDKHAKNLRLLYKNKISNVIQELDGDAIKGKTLYYKNESPDFRLTTLTDMTMYDKGSFAIYGAYPVQEKTVASSFLGSKEVEIKNITRYTDDLIVVTVILKNNACADTDSLVLGKTFRAAIKTDDNIWTDSKGVVLEFAAGEFGPEKSYGICNYVKESNNFKFINSALILANGTTISPPFFPDYINCHINKIKRNAFRTVIPLVFQITEDKKLDAFKFADFTEIQLTGFDLLSKINKVYAPPQYKNNLTVINKTGKVAFVKIANIPNHYSIAELRIIADNDSCVFYLPNGEYREFVRLGCEPPFEEFKGADEMNFAAPAGSFLDAILTLQPVIGGTHQTGDSEPGEFDAIGK